MVELQSGWVGGEGVFGSDVMIVGEALGKEEQEQGRPFVGRSGQLLRSELQGAGLDPAQTWITNVVKWRPPGNRTPTDEEISECLDCLTQEIREGQPKYVLAVGNVPFQTLVGTKLGITLYRGFWHRLATSFEYEDALLFATYHPAYLLYNPKQIHVWRQDLQRFAEKVGEK